jgi:hypothetical protein
LPATSTSEGPDAWLTKCARQCDVKPLAPHAYRTEVREREDVRMRFKSRIAALFGLLILPACASSIAVIGGTYYAPQYDFAEFFAATDGRNFQVILVGNPFPGTDP